MASATQRPLLKVLKIAAYPIGSILVILFIAPYFIPDSVNQRVKTWANESIKGKLDYSSARFSFFKEFPSLTLTVSDISLNGSMPFSNDNLLSAKELSVGINPWALINSKIQVTLFSIDEADINILVNQKGEANYNIIQPKRGQADSSADADVSLRIQKIIIRSSALHYDDQSTKMLIHGTGFNYVGKGDLDKAVFDLYTDLKVDSFDLVYDHVPYIRKKQVAGKLITSVNTNSLALKFTENQLRINKLPIVFDGRFEFLNQGYFMDFSIRSEKSRLLDLFTAFPPQYQGWLNETKVKGTVDLLATLKGRYVGNNEKPEFFLSAAIHNGYISNKKTTVPLQALNLSMKVKLPSLDPEQMIFDSDSLNFLLAKNVFRSNIHIRGLSNPEIHAKINGDVDLQLLDNALGIPGVEMKGLAHVNIVADGRYRMAQNPRSRRPENILMSIPSYQVSTSVSNGSIRYDSLTESIHDISFQLTASCADSNFRNSRIKLENLKGVAMGNTLSGKLHLNLTGQNDIQAQLKTKLDCNDLTKFLPRLPTKLKGIIDINVHADGNYLPDKHQFPVTSADLSWAGGEIQTAYYPSPVKNIKMLMHLKNTTADYKDLSVEIEPIEFQFENQPFRLEARIHDFRDPAYDIRSVGVIELGKICKAFSIDGMNAEGKINTDFWLRGRQSDITAARVSQLQNSGTLKLEQIHLNTEYLPEKILIERGVVQFNQDKIFLKNINAKYQSNRVELNGELGSVISYLLDTNGILTGKFTLKSDSLLLDEFQYYSDPGNSDSTITTTSSSGTIVVPGDLRLQLQVSCGQLLMQGIRLKDFESSAALNHGQATISNMHFMLADGSFNGSARYLSNDPSSAMFNLKVRADSFDIEKAYNQIPIFQTMMPSAASVKGVIGLKYELSGLLDQSMMPVYSSLSGGGELTVKHASLKGFKLMNAVSRSTNTAEIRDKDVKKVIIRSTVSNNIVTIRRTKLKIAGFRPRFEGQISLDGKYNLKGRLGLPPLGVIGIPFHVVGSQENPEIKLGKGKSIEEPAQADDE